VCIVSALVEHFDSLLYCTIYLVTRSLIRAAHESRAPSTSVGLSYLLAYCKTPAENGKLFDAWLTTDTTTTLLELAVDSLPRLLGECGRVVCRAHHPVADSGQMMIRFYIMTRLLSNLESVSAT
jgi:hypothetical protein